MVGIFKFCVVRLRKEYIEYFVVVIGIIYFFGNLVLDIYEVFLYKVDIEVS